MFQVQEYNKISCRRQGGHFMPTLQCNKTRHNENIFQHCKKDMAQSGNLSFRLSDFNDCGISSRAKHGISSPLCL